jgi:hypothetical protein
MTHQYRDLYAQDQSLFTGHQRQHLILDGFFASFWFLLSFPLLWHWSLPDLLPSW